MPLASVWSEHLSSPKYLHILLNSLPVYWLAAGVLSSVLALISQNRAARVVALAGSSLARYRHGQSIITAKPHMIASKQWQAATATNGSMSTSGAASNSSTSSTLPLLCRLAQLQRNLDCDTRPLILASANLGVGFYIAYAGGHIRHKEFRFEPPPPARREEHHHEHEH